MGPVQAVQVRFNTWKLVRPMRVCVVTVSVPSSSSSYCHDYHLLKLLYHHGDLCTQKPYVLVKHLRKQLTEQGHCIGWYYKYYNDNRFHHQEVRVVKVEELVHEVEDAQPQLNQLNSYWTYSVIITQLHNVLAMLNIELKGNQIAMRPYCTDFLTSCTCIPSTVLDFNSCGMHPLIR